MKFRALKQITGPTTPVVSLDEAKTHLRIDHSDEDAYISALVTSATNFVEEFTGRSLITQTWRASFDRWPPNDCGFNVLELPRPELLSVESLKYYDINGSLTTVDPSNYTVEFGTPGFITIRKFFGYPSLEDDRKLAIELEFTSGYGPAPEDVPQILRQAIHLMLKHFYEIRMPVLENMNATKVPLSVQTILKLFRVRSL